jgi:hypothetical protein
MSLPEPLAKVTERLAEKVSEPVLESLLKALLGARNPVLEVERATILALSHQAYRRPDLDKKEKP